MELDGDKCNVETVRDLEQTLMLVAPDSWRVVIVNEAHAMSRQAVQAWLTLLERLPVPGQHGRRPWRHGDGHGHHRERQGTPGRENPPSASGFPDTRPMCLLGILE